MCRRKLFHSRILISFGIGILICCLIGSSVLRFLLGLGCVFIGFFLMRNC